MTRGMRLVPADAERGLDGHGHIRGLDALHGQRLLSGLDTLHGQVLLQMVLAEIDVPYASCR